METPHIALGAEPLFHIGPIPFTNSFLVMLLVMTFLLILFSWIARKVQPDPQNGGRAGAFGEFIIEFLLNLAETSGGRKLGRSVFPLISALFIFIITANFTGLLPGIGSIWVDKTPEYSDVTETDEMVPSGEHEVATAAVQADDDTSSSGTVTSDEHDATGDGAAADDGHHEVHTPLFRPPTADLNMTLALSTLTFIVVQIMGVRAHGVRGRLKHMASPPFLFPIEVVSELSRILSLAARLFGNVFAGEVLLGVAYGIAQAVKIAIIPVLFPVMFLFLEVLFGTIQALVFSLLTLIYIYLAAAGHDDHDESHAESHDLVRAVDDHPTASADDARAHAAPAGD